MCFCIFWDIWVLRNPTFLAKTKSFVNGSAGAYTARAKCQRLFSQKRRGHLALCAVHVQKLRLRIGITWFQCSFDFGRKYDLILVLRSQFFEYLRETLYKHALTHLEGARSEKNGKNDLFVKYIRKHLTIIGVFEVL